MIFFILSIHLFKYYFLHSTAKIDENFHIFKHVNSFFTRKDFAKNVFPLHNGLSIKYSNQSESLIL